MHHHDGPWQELSDVGDYHAANMALLDPSPPLALEEVYANPMRCQALLPPSRILGGTVDRCLVGEGSIMRVRVFMTDWQAVCDYACSRSTNT